MKKSVTYDVNMIESILEIFDSKLIPHMTFKGIEDITALSDILRILRENGEIRETQENDSNMPDLNPNDDETLSEKTQGGFGKD